MLIDSQSRYHIHRRIFLLYFTLFHSILLTHHHHQLGISTIFRESFLFWKNWEKILEEKKETTESKNLWWWWRLILVPISLIHSTTTKKTFEFFIIFFRFLLPKWNRENDDNNNKLMMMIESWELRKKNRKKQQSFRAYFSPFHPPSSSSYTPSDSLYDPAMWFLCCKFFSFTFLKIQFSIIDFDLDSESIRIESNFSIRSLMMWRDFFFFSFILISISFIAFDFFCCCCCWHTYSILSIIPILSISLRVSSWLKK